MRQHLKRLIKTAAVYGLGSVGVQIVGFLLLPIFTRYLTPGDYGILETLTTIASIISILLICGMDNSVFLFYFDSDDPRQKRQVLATASLFIGFLAVTSVTGLLFASGWLNQRLFAMPGTLVSLRLAILLGAFLALYKMPTNVFRLKRQPGRFSTVNILNMLIGSGLSIWFLVGLGRGFQGRIEASTITAGFILILALWLCRESLAARGSWQLLKKMLKTALPVIPAGLAIWVLALFDRFLLLKLTSAGEVGLYAIGMRFASLVTLVIAAFTLGWSEFALSLKESDDRNRIYARVLTYFTLITGAIVLALSLFAHEALTVMATPAYLRAAEVIPILGLAYIASGYYTIMAVGLNLTKKMGAILPVTAIPAALSVIANLILIPRLGMLGAALTNLGCYSLMALLMFLASQRVYPIKYEWGRILKIFGVLVPIIVVSRLLPSSGCIWADAATHAALFLLFAILLLMMGFFSKEESLLLGRLFGIGRQKTEDRRQKREERRQKTEDRRQKTE